MVRVRRYNRFDWRASKARESAQKYALTRREKERARQESLSKLNARVTISDHSSSTWGMSLLTSILGIVLGIMLLRYLFAMITI